MPPSSLTGPSGLLRSSGLSRPSGVSRRAGARGGRRLVVVLVCVGACFGAPGMEPPGAAADSTPAPRAAVTPTPAPCPPGSTPTLAPHPPHPQPPRPATATAGVPEPTCQLVPPRPQRGPTIAPEHTVGGPRLATAGTVVEAVASVPAPPSVSDVAWTISDLDTGEVLAAKNPHALLLPASTVKALLALVTMPALPPARVVRASTGATRAEGTRVGLVGGAPYRVGQLFLGLVLVSGNDTAYALADAYGGRAKTVEAMNAQAARLGAWDTVVKDPSGLDVTGQRTSAYDLALVGRAVMRLPQYRRDAVVRSYLFPGGTDPKGTVFAPFQIQNHNQLLEHYPGATGVKNGYTTGARHTFIGTATRGGHTLLVTELGGVTLPSWQPTAALLDWAFAHRAGLRPVGTLVAPGAPQPPEWRGVTPSTPPASSSTSAPGTAPAVGITTPSSRPRGEPAVLAHLASSPVTDAGLLAAAAALLGVGRLTLRARRRRSG